MSGVTTETEAKRSLSLDKRSDGVAIVTFDTPDSAVNILSRELFDEIAEILDDVESDDAVRACVLASAKPGTFIAGANLKQLIAVETAAEGEAFSKNGRGLLDRIAACKKPFVAAIHGAALGGGLEVALSCHYRIASDDPKTVLALPEVMLGLLPGGAGTQRLPRLVGLATAMPLMLTGKRIRARKALRMGLVDALTSPGNIAETAAIAALRLADGTLAPKRRKLSAMDKFLESAPGRRIGFNKAKAGVMAKTRGLYPAPLAIIRCVDTGYSRGMKAGLETESVEFGKLAAGPEAKCLIGLFESMNELKKPAGGKPRAVDRIAILGGGFMGSGIAAVSIPHVPTVVKDISDEVLARCGKSIDDGLRKRMRSGAISRFDRDVQWTRLLMTTDPADLAGTDLVIEAVFENLDLKRKILAETEAVVSPTTVFASNTSALPIGSIAENATHPERVLGMHYFSPVPKMPLLELIVTDRTAPWATATARAVGVRQGKTVVVVKDGPGFYTSRILGPFLGEAVELLREGARIPDVDKALKNFGYPVGPLALLDEVGIDVAAHVTEELGGIFADRGLEASDAFPKMYEAGLSGRKSKKGFYLYDGKRGKKGRPINEDVYRFFGDAPRKDFAASEIASRLALLMINEAIHCLQEKIIACPRDGDVGAILGLGFPPFRGGPFRYVDSRGPAEIVAEMEGLRDRLNAPRFEPATLLRDLAREGGKFHS
jgi:3-hydroxyacyl-CoA dehydrogenase/enoyl-CoA hydratase/carnithine racemase